jgi:two-component system sensor histidine kinase KdpD
MKLSADARTLGLGLAGITGLAAVFRVWPQVSSPATVALSFLVVVLLVAATAHLWVAVTTSLAAMLAFNFFFLPPVGTLTIADPQNWIALIAFLAVSLVASNLSAVARERTHEAVMRRDELGRLFDLSRDVLLITDSRQANSLLAGFVSRRFELEYAAICLPHGDEWIVFRAGPQELTIDPRELSRAFSELDAVSRSAADGRPDAAVRVLTVGHHSVHLARLRLGTKPIGLLAAAGRPIEPGTLEAVAGLAAIAIERAQFLDDRKDAELARQSEELKSALLASLAHDLRTPLTAVRVAASNLQASWLGDEDRREQSQLILTEVSRLTRLFENILEMARIEAGAVAASLRWVDPAEIVEAARAQSEPALEAHALEVDVVGQRLVRLDPRLTAAALAHLLENAAQYAPAQSVIHVAAAVTDAGLEISVRDHGPGIQDGELAHLFERFYRGAGAKRRATGTGMGLSIARGLLAVENGLVAAENCSDGGARFTIRVAAQTKAATPIESAP